MKKFLTSVLILAAPFYFSQKVEVLQKSSYTHNYALGRFDFIEDDADTVGMKFIASIRVKYDAKLPPLHEFELCKIKGKDLGGNCFRLKNYKELDSVASLTLDVWFAPDKKMETNEKKRMKGCALLFPSLRITGHSATFYLNDQALSFPSTNYYVADTSKSKEFVVSVCKMNLFSKKIKVKAAKTAQFYFLGPTEEDKLKIIAFGLLAIGEQCKPSPIAYNLGRLLELIYRPKTSH
jgi:hypothetical protein